MKRFKFRLQRLLELRIQIRDEARQELGRLNAQLEHQVTVLRDLESESASVHRVGDGTFSAGELLLRGAYIERLQRAIEQQMARIAETKRSVLAAQERYIQANKEARALEMLRDRKRDEYQLEALRDEVAQLDEIATRRAAIKG